MGDLYSAYLDLLDTVKDNLERLCALAQQKTAAVQADDLIALDQVLKQEQALSMSLRGLEQKRAQQAAQLGLGQTPLSALATVFPPSLQMRTKQSVEELQIQYGIYRSAAEVARDTLECNLHEIEKVIAGLDGTGAAGPGYASSEVEPPAAMKTDFRA